MTLIYAAFIVSLTTTLTMVWILQAHMGGAAWYVRSGVLILSAFAIFHAFGVFDPGARVPLTYVMDRVFNLAAWLWLIWFIDYKRIEWNPEGSK